MLNGLWLSFFLVATVSAFAQWLVGGNAGVFAAIVESIFAMAKLSVEVMVLLFGTLTLWLGFLRIAEKAGIVDWLGRALGPLFKRLMPEVPPGHPALGFITLNFAANGLGLDNAATPIGLKAMRALQELNPSPNSVKLPRIEDKPARAVADIVASKAMKPPSTSASNSGRAARPAPINARTWRCCGLARCFQ